MKKLTVKEIKTAVEEAADTFEGYYLDWVNDFLTIEGYAEYYGLELAKAKSRISTGRKIHAERTSK